MILKAPRWKGTSLRGLRGTFDLPIPPGTVVPPAGSAADQMQAEIDALFSYTGAGQPAPESIPCDPGINPNCGSGQSFTSWLNANAMYVALGVGGFVLLMSMGGRHR